jgi:phospholipid transport system substrate-binding protein
MMRNTILTSAILLFAGLSAQAEEPIQSAAAAAMPPDQVVEQTAKGMFDTISSRRAELEKNPQELYKVVGDNLLPHFDFGRASQLVLGQYWRTATPDQRKAFQDAFYKYLVHGYADALLKGNYSDRNIQVEPWHPGSDPTKAYVKTKVLRENAPPVEVDYSLLNEQGGWKAFDVVIEGISYVLNYRNQFGPEIQQQGLDELIKRLNTDADKGTIAQPDKP